jgi:hypothetical protein
VASTKSVVVDVICEGWKVDMTHCHKSRERKKQTTAFIIQVSVKIKECSIEMERLPIM